MHSRYSVADALTITGHWRILMHDAATGALLSDHEADNVICQNGKNFIAAWLNQEVGYGANPTIYGAVGTSSQAPDVTNSSLVAEIARNPLAVAVRSANVLTWSFFFSTAQGNGTWAEVGCFLNGTTALNSGSILSRLLQAEVKDSSKTATMQLTLTIG